MSEPGAHRARAPRPSRKIGLSPGTLIHVGRRLADAVAVEVYRCEPGAAALERRVLARPEELRELRGAPGLTWVDINGIHDVELIAVVGEVFGLHPLLLEDVVNAHQRPKFEQHGDQLFLVVRMILPEEGDAGFASEQVSVVIGDGFVLTFQERERDTFDPVRRRLIDSGSRVRQHGADFLAYALVDTIVDNYFAVLERLGDRLDALEDRLIDDPDRDALQEVYEVRCGVVDLRRAVWPLRDALAAMTRGDHALIRAETLPYLRDVHDHTLRVIDTVETHRELAATLVEMYMSGVSNRMNEVMRVLTVIATLFIPLTFVVGVYGMNFAHMPELGWRGGYPAVWGVIVVVTGGMLLFFRRRGWL